MTNVTKSLIAMRIEFSENKEEVGKIPTFLFYSSLNPCNFNAAISVLGFLKSSILSASGLKK